ncbi:MAG TPA: LysR family substrate-binding domain-containing protein, partial [Homoserinimonas sp.]|nr:LysR family substrate-binding domain-containing protein [Homoserinimonas sp.]
IQVNLFSSNFARVGLEKILDGEFDLACGRWAAIPGGIGTMVLAVERIVLAVSDQHPLANRGTVKFAEVAHERYIMLPDHPGAVLRDRLFELSHRVGATPDVRQIAPDTWTVLALVAENLGVTLTLSTVRDSTWFPGVVFLELEDAVATADLSLAWRSPTIVPAVQVAIDAAESVFPPVAR